MIANTPLPCFAARLVPIVVTPHRCRTKRQFWSYSGLGIVTRSSSDWVQTADGGWVKARVAQTRGLSRQHNRFLKAIFKGAATTVIMQRTKDPTVGADGGEDPGATRAEPLQEFEARSALRFPSDARRFLAP